MAGWTLARTLNIDFASIQHNPPPPACTNNDVEVWGCVLCVNASLLSLLILFEHNFSQNMYKR